MYNKKTASRVRNLPDYYKRCLSAATIHLQGEARNLKIAELLEKYENQLSRLFVAVD